MMRATKNTRDEAPEGFFATKDKGVFVDKSMIATCPFDRSHMMKKGRLQYHIIDCIKNYEGTKVPCPYNHTEYFEPHDLLTHLRLCPRRNDSEVQRFESHKNRENTIKTNPHLLERPRIDDERHSDENWGLD